MSEIIPMRLKLLLLLIPSIIGAHAQVITTIAGTDFVFPPTPIRGLDAPLGTITDLAYDSQGNLFIADIANHAVFRLAPDGTLTTVAGNGIGQPLPTVQQPGEGGPATSASISPSAIAVDAAGVLYIRSGFGLRKVAGGIISTIPGVKVSTAYSGGACCMAVDSAGAVYFPDNDFFAETSQVIKLANGVTTVVAGAGPRVFSGDGGPATEAGLNLVTGLFVDRGGTLYIGDNNNNRIRKVAPGGIISTIAGNGVFDPSPVPKGDGGPATETPVSFIGPIRGDAAGNIYVGTGAGVRKISAGIISTVPSVSPLFDLDSQGNFAFAAIASGEGAFYDQVRVKAPAGDVSTAAGNGYYKFGGDGGPATSAYLNLKNLYNGFGNGGIVTDAQGNIYVSDANNRRVRRISKGIITTVAGNGAGGCSGDGGPATEAAIGQPSSLGISPAGDLYIAGCRLWKVSNGVIQDAAPGVPIGSGGVVTILPFAWDSKGDLYIGTELYIYKVSGGVATIVAGTGVRGSDGDGGPATAAKIYVADIAIDADDNIYVAERFNRVRVIKKGTILPFAGKGTTTNIGGFSGDGGPALDAEFYLPAGVSVDSQGTVYIADFNNNRIRRVKDGIITTFAGNGGAGTLGDGLPATQATITTPAAIHVDKAGNLYLVDNFFGRVREVLAAPPAAQVTPLQLTFSGSSNGALPPRQTLSLSSPVPGLPFYTQLKAEGNTPWLRVSPETGVFPRRMEVTADPTGLDPGTYQGEVTVVHLNGAPIFNTVAVTLTVGPPQPPRLSVDKQALSFPFPSHGKARALPVMVSNAGGGSLEVTTTVATNAGGGWLSVAPSGGQALPDTPLLLNVTADPAGLPPGTYTGVVNIAGGGSVQAVAVAMTISAIDQSLLLSQSGLSFLGVSQGGVIAPQTFGVINTGSGVVNWTVSKSTLSGGPDWLQVSTANATNSGSSDAAGAVPMVTVTARPALLAPGKYYGQVRIDAPATANSPQVVTIFLQVLEPGFDFGAMTQTAELLFATSLEAGSPGSQDVLLYNVTATPKTFRTSVSTDAGLNLQVLPGDGTLDPSRANRIVVQPTIGAAPGVYNGTVTFQFSDGRVRSVLVSVVVASEGTVTTTNGTRVFRAAAACQPTQLLTALTTLGASFSVSAGWPVALGVEVKDDCGAPLDAGSVTIAFSNGDPPLSLNNLTGGHWETTWQTRSTPQQVILKLRAADSRGALLGSREVPGTLQAQTDPPVFAKPGIVSAASGESFAPLSPGSIVSIYGERLAPATQSAGAAPLPDMLADTSVTIGGTMAPLYFVSPGQVNAQVPFGINPNTTHQVLVTRGSTYSQPIAVDMAPAQPAVFVDTATAPEQGIVIAVRNVDGARQQFEAKPGSPARAGDVLVVYAAGLGAVDPPVATGAAAPDTALSNTANPVRLNIGGKSVTPQFAGLAPGFVGLYQVNATVPDGIQAGDAVPVTLSVAGQTSPAVTIAIE